ncbi:MAG: hypothetical protein ACFB20_04855 [Opitutales bacterium]
MSTSKKVLLIGLKASAVNYAKWPELSVEKLEAAFKQILADLKAAGYWAKWCLVDVGATAEAEVRAALTEDPPDVVVIGAGVRTDEDHFRLFEKTINVVHREAPNASIAFNSNPFDTVAAVQRWG